MIDHIYIAHCAKLTARREYINSILDHPFFAGITTVNAATAADDDARMANNTYQSGVIIQALKKQEIVFMEQMFNIFEDIVAKGYKRVLVLEDDFRLDAGFDANYERVFAEIPSDADCTFLGTCCNLLAPSNYPHEFYPTETSRCGIAYTPTLDFCKKILAERQYTLPLDWHLTEVRRKQGGKFYWSKTILFIQGSETVYPSNIR